MDSPPPKETLRDYPPQRTDSPQGKYPQRESYTSDQGHKPFQSQGYTAQPPMQAIPLSYIENGDLEASIESTLVETFKPNSFQNGFCSCFGEYKTCCLGFWCPCVLFGHTHARFQNPALKRDELPSCSGACCGYAAVLLLCVPMQCIFGCAQRGNIRAKYGIESNGCLDCLAHTFCDCCVTYPLTYEIDGRL